MNDPTPERSFKFVHLARAWYATTILANDARGRTDDILVNYSDKANGDWFEFAFVYLESTGPGAWKLEVFGESVPGLFASGIAAHLPNLPIKANASQVCEWLLSIGATDATTTVDPYKSRADKEAAKVMKLLEKSADSGDQLDL